MHRKLEARGKELEFKRVQLVKLHHEREELKRVHSEELQKQRDEMKQIHEEELKKLRGTLLVRQSQHHEGRAPETNTMNQLCETVLTLSRFINSSNVNIRD